MLYLRCFSRWLAAILFLLFSIVGCTSFGRVQGPEIKPIESTALPSGNGWWYARFRMSWPPESQAVWHIDLYLAHQVIKPILVQHKNEIVLWRFHRRAARDRAGRQFSFIFYSAPGTARTIFNTLKSNTHIKNLKLAGIIDKDVYDNPESITRPGIEDTSDKNWPVSIQKSWPYYIMGVSQMWLDLISEVAEDKLDKTAPSSLGDIELFYQEVNESLMDLWQKEGRHAFMHHLNALFEYKPLIYYQKLYLTF